VPCVICTSYIFPDHFEYDASTPDEPNNLISFCGVNDNLSDNTKLNVVDDAELSTDAVTPHVENRLLFL
jgi:hypothetical protein